jgi:hypothetical protein
LESASSFHLPCLFTKGILEEDQDALEELLCGYVDDVAALSQAPLDSTSFSILHAKRVRLMKKMMSAIVRVRERVRNVLSSGLVLVLIDLQKKLLSTGDLTAAPSAPPPPSSAPPKAPASAVRLQERRSK